MIHDVFTQAYLDCAWWTATSPEGEPLDHNPPAWSDAAENQARRECAEFQKANADDLRGLITAQAGHDFWLTRNRHGAGFWDRGYDEDVAQRLTDAAHKAGSRDVLVGDDDMVYFYPEL